MSENEEVLTIQQQHVLTLLAQGSTVSAAAEAAGVHRNTVANWRRAGSHEFRKCWDAAQFEQAAYWRDRIQALGDLAIQALEQILVDPKASPSVRLKAATTVLNTIASPTAVKTAQSAQRSEETSDLDRMIAQAGYIPPEWRAKVEADMRTAPPKQTAATATACASSNSAQTCTTHDSNNDLSNDPTDDTEESIDQEMQGVLQTYLKRVLAGETPFTTPPPTL